MIGEFQTVPAGKITVILTFECAHYLKTEFSSLNSVLLKQAPKP